MVRNLLLGVVVAILAVGVWLLVNFFQLGAVNALVGIVAGLVLALVRDGSPLARYSAFLIGLVLGILLLILGLAGWIGWVVAILLLTLISGLTKGKLPLWAMILGGGTLAAIYEPYLFASPWYVFTQYPTSLLVALASSSGGFLAVIFVELFAERKEIKAELRESAPPPQPVTSSASTTADSIGDGR